MSAAETQNASRPTMTMPSSQTSVTRTVAKVLRRGFSSMPEDTRYDQGNEACLLAGGAPVWWFDWNHWVRDESPARATSRVGAKARR